MDCLVELGQGAKSVPVVRQDIPGDAKKPWPEGRAFLEGLGIAQHPQEDFLGQILAQGGLVGEINEEPIDRPVVPIEKKPHQVTVSRTDLAHDLGIVWHLQRHLHRKGYWRF
jgi:hypothetical protein